MNPENQALTVPSSPGADKPITWSWSISSAESAEVEKRLREKCTREPAAYIPTVWQVLSRGLGVAAGIGLYRWIGKKG